MTISVKYIEMAAGTSVCSVQGTVGVCFLSYLIREFSTFAVVLGSVK